MAESVGDALSVGLHGWRKSTEVPPAPEVRDTPEENLREVLSNTEQFQAVTETATAGSAAAFVGLPFDPAYLEGVAQTDPGPTDFRAVIGGDKEASTNLFGTGAVVGSGSIPLRFIADIAADDDEEDAFTEFKATCIAIIEDMHKTSQEGAYLVLQAIETDEPPMRERREQGVQEGTDGPFEASYMVGWGLEAPSPA